MANFKNLSTDQIVVSKSALDASARELDRLRKLVQVAPVPIDNSTEIQRLQDEIMQLKAAKALVKMIGGSLKITGKGGISLYGLGKYPVTLYVEQWVKLLDGTADIREFIEVHKGELKKKGA